MTDVAHNAGVVPRLIHLAVAIDRLLVRQLTAAACRWVVKGGYGNQLRRPHEARFTEDLTSSSIPPSRRPRAEHPETNSLTWS